MSYTRQLTAIMFTDIQGYTAMMQHDEALAIKIRERHRKIFNSNTEKFNGKILQYFGDGTLSTFTSAIDAVNCAMKMQLAFQKEPIIPVRIGIHLGDIVITEEEIIGDGVNVASRIESLSVPGSVFISDKVYDEIKNHSSIEAQSLKTFELKNVDKPMEVFAISNKGLIIPNAEDVKGKTKDTNSGSFKSQAKNQLKESKKKLIWFLYTILGLLLIIGGYLIYQNGFLTKDKIDGLDKSIAVLPFENISDDESNQYFADGQMEAILNHLTKIADLKVISRTTMMGYRGTTRSVPEIGKELGVRYILEGSVQKFGQKVRITAQMIDSYTDEHLWSESYDRDLKDIFAIQTEIAKSVAQELRITIPSLEQTIIEAVPTSNLTAYDFYLKGVDYLYRSYLFEEFNYAIQMFDRAVEIDPDYTLAWVGLASASRSIYWFHYDRSDSCLDQIRQNLDRAIHLDPDLMEVQLETGMYYYQCKLDYFKALQILEKLKSEYPKNDQMVFWAAQVYRRMGQFEKAFEYMNKAISLNPSNGMYWAHAGETLIILRKYAQAEEYLKTAIDLNPSEGGGHYNLALLYLTTGEIEKADKLLVNIQNFDQSWMYMMRSQVELMKRNYNKAIHILKSSPHNVTADQFAFMPKPLQLGLIYFIMGNQELAYTNFYKASKVLENKLAEFPNDSRLYSSLGIVYSGLGKKEEALTAGNRALAAMNISVDAWIGYHREWDMARILLMNGEYDGSIAKLEMLLEKYGDLSVEQLKIDPFWDPIRDKESFKLLVESQDEKTSFIE